MDNRQNGAKHGNTVAGIVVSCVLIVLLTVALVVGIVFHASGNFFGLGEIGISFGSSSFSGDNSYTEGECDLPAEGVRVLEIGWKSGSVNVRTDPQADTVTVSESGGDGENVLCWKQSGNRLSVRYRKRAGFELFLGSSPKKDLTVTLPEGTSLDRLEFDIASAATRIQGLTLGALEYDAASGGLTVTDCAISGVFDLDTASGDLTMTDCTVSGECSLDTASGDMNFTDVTCGSLDVDMASGKIVFSGEVGSVNQDSASGDAEYRLKNVPRKIEIDTASGDVTLYLPSDAGFDVDMDAASGKITCGFADATVEKRHAYRAGSPSCKIEMDAASGSLSVQPNP